MSDQTSVISPQILSLISSLKDQFDEIPKSRKPLLGQIADYIRQQIASQQKAELIFICTHNSRRSHFGQIWAQVAATYYDLPEVHTYSGGTEATAFNPNAIEALISDSFVITGDQTTTNPRYQVVYSPSLPSLQAWSKVFADPANPQTGFCAVMTCSEADEACPAVFGASARVSLPYEDPKKSDGTPEQNATYRERSHEIAREMLYMASLV